AEAHEVGVLALYSPTQPVVPPRRVPLDEHAAAFVAREARFEGTDTETMYERISRTGWGEYILDGVRSGRLRFTAAWNALGGSFIEAYQLLYSKGAMEISSELRALLVGEIEDTAARLRADRELVIREIEFVPSFDPDEATPQLAEIAFDPTVANAPV